MAEIMKNTCNGYPVYEITSSGMTHTGLTTFGPLVWLPVYVTMPFTYNIGMRTLEKNYGTIEIDWETHDIFMRIHNSNGNTLLEERIKLEDLYKKCSRSYLCDQTERYRNLVHMISMISVYILPLSMNLLSVWIYLRKYSHTY